MQAAVLAVAVLILVGPRPGATQETAGSLTGRILTADGAALVEAEVTATGHRLLGSRSGLTTAQGYFRLPALPAGEYSVRIRRVGFRPIRFEQVPVRLGTTTSLGEIRLETETVELAELVVSGDRALVDPTSTASTITLDAHQLDALPLSRNFRDITLLAPTSIPSYIGDGINIGGATGIENSYFVDGIDITDPIQGKTTLDLPYNFIQQIEIRTGGSTAEDAQALGGVINVVTPSGGDRLRGGGFAFFTADPLEADSRDGSSESFTFYDVGATLGGPLLPQRLWFFAAYNRTSETVKHTFSFGGLNDASHQHLFAGKLTWRAGPRTTAFFTILGDPSRNEGIGYPLFATGDPINREAVEKKRNSGGVALSLRGQHFLTPALLIEGSAALMTRLEEDEPATPAGRTPAVADQLDGTLYGGNGLASRFDSRRHSFNLSASWRLGAHALRAGAFYQTLYLDQTFDFARTGAGGTITRADTALWSWHWVRVQNGRAQNQMPSAFLQDGWQVNERLLLNGGLRWSRQRMLNVNAGTVSFRVDDGWQPRLGAIYQLGTIGTQRLYASFSRVANQIVPWGAEANGFGAETLMVFPRDPRVDTTGGTIVYTLPRGGGLSGDGTLRGETAEEWAIGYDRQLTRGFGLSVRAVRRAHRDAVQLGQTTPGTLLYGNPGRGALSSFPRQQRTYHALELVLERTRGQHSPWVRLSYVLSRTQGNYPGLYGSDWRLPFTHYGPMYFTPDQHVNGSGLLPNDRTHLFKLFGAQQVGSRLVLGASFLLASGTPLSEYGAIQIPPPFRGFARPRGAAGRTPTIWDLALRATYDFPFALRSGMRARLLLDLENVGSPRKPVDYDQIRFSCLDDTGNQACPHAGYGQVTQYQPPMTARFGLEMGF